MKKTFRIWGLAFCAMALSAVLPAGQAYAGEWRQDETGFWYQEDDGSYPINSWKWIDGNGDGIAECYFFDRSGYLAVNTTTPDGYTVDENGAWVLDGVVQTRSAEEAASLPETAGGSGPSRVTAPEEGQTAASGAEGSGASGTAAPYPGGKGGRLQLQPLQCRRPAAGGDHGLGAHGRRGTGPDGLL